MIFNLELNLVNEQILDAEGIMDIFVSYSCDSIYLFRNNTEKFILREFMSYEPEMDELANITIDKNTLTIESGKRHTEILSFGGRRRRIEIYLPLDYKNNLKVRNSSGSIKSEEKLRFLDFNAHSSSGSIKLNDIEAKNIDMSSSSGNINMNTAVADKLRVKSSSGSIKLHVVRGDSILSASSGLITVDDIKGKVEASASSGCITMSVIELIDDINASTNSGSIHLYIPGSSSFEFKARTSSGSIKTYFDTSQSYVGRKNNIHLNIGENPKSKVELTASSGGIKLNSL